MIPRDEDRRRPWSRVLGTEYSERRTQWTAIAACASRRNQSTVQLLTCVVTMSTLHGPPPAAMRWMKTKQHKCCQLAAVDDGRADDGRGSGSRTRNLNNNVTARPIPDEKAAYITRRRQKWCLSEGRHTSRRHSRGCSCRFATLRAHESQQRSNSLTSG